MNDHTNPMPDSVAERDLLRLVRPETAADVVGSCLDVIHEPDLELLWAGQA